MHTLKTSRPRFWIYLFGPYVLGVSALFVSSGLSEHLVPLLLFATYFLFPANLLVYGVNDIFDYETDLLNVKKRGYETLVPPDHRKRLWIQIALTNIPFLILAPFILPLPSLLGLLGFLFFGFFYSAPPIRAKSKPFLDSIFNVLYVFPALVSFGFIGLPPLSLFLAGTLWSMAMHAYSAVPDIHADTEANLSTIATQLGRKNTFLLCLGLYVLSASLTLPFIGWLGVLLGTFYSAMILLSIRTTTETELRIIYTYFPYLNTFSGFILTLFILSRSL